MIVMDNAKKDTTISIFFALEYLDIMPPPSASCRLTDRTDLYPELRRLAGAENIGKVFFEAEELSNLVLGFVQVEDYSAFSGCINN